MVTGKVRGRSQGGRATFERRARLAGRAAASAAHAWAAAAGAGPAIKAPPAPAPLLSTPQPQHLHGSLGRDGAAGAGAVLGIRELLRKDLVTSIEKCSFVVQVGAALHHSA